MYEEEGQQQGDGLDDEIDRLAPSLELIRDWPMYSPQRWSTNLEFGVQRDSPQRSPTLWCFDQEQFPDQPHQRESTSYRRHTGVRITISSEDDSDSEYSRLNLHEVFMQLRVSCSTLRRIIHNFKKRETETIEAMARKRKATYVGEGKENSQLRPLQERNDGVVIRDDIDDQNVNLIPINEVQPLRERVVFGNELDQNVIHIHEETERIEAMARKRKATYVGEGKENSLGYSLEEGRNVEVNSLMDEKLYSWVKDIRFQPSWPEVEIMQEDSSEQQILGELSPKNIGNKAVQKKEKGHSEKNIGHKVASAEKSCKKKSTTETPTKKYWTKRFISKEDLLEHVGLKRADAADALGVSVSTFKRRCRKYRITCWNGDGCPCPHPRPRVEPELLNNSVHQSSPGSIPAEVRGEKETSALLRAKQDDVTIKAKYGENILKFRLSSESGVKELNKKVAKRSLLELGSFKVEYLDEDEEPIWIACDEDFQYCVEFFSRSSSNEVIRLLVNKVSNSEKSHQSCSGLKRNIALLHHIGRGRRLTTFSISLSHFSGIYPTLKTSKLMVIVDSGR